MIDHILLIVVPFLVSLVAVTIVHPHIVRIAREKGIVDKPNARKLQKEPVPILGGTVVFFGIALGAACVHTQHDGAALLAIFASMTIMLYTGTMDDILDLRPTTRLLVQLFAVGLLLYTGHFGLNNLHGLWGIYHLPAPVTILLTLFACVGIINALNLIDGVDGLSSGFCILASLIFGLLFLFSGANEPLCVLAASTVGSLIPFFLHNVFGQRSKMFIGDGGTLLMGAIMSVFVMRTIQSESASGLLASHGYSPVAFTLAVLSIPVFDTLRVMTARICRRQSPFHPDKTHLHHLFIGLGCSHIVTTIIILALDLTVVASWLLAGYLGATAEIQLYTVCIVALLATAGIYGAFALLRRLAPARYDRIVELNLRYRPRREGFFLRLQHWIDKI